MERFRWVYCLVFYICSCAIALEAEQPNVDHQLTNIPGKQDLSYVRKPIMIVSDLKGRKKRGLGTEDGYVIPILEKGSLRDAAVELKNDGRLKFYNYTPRLGRESAEESEIENWLHLLNERSPPFAPRLGRRTKIYYV